MNPSVFPRGPRIVLVVLALTATLGFSGCSDDDPSESESSESTSAPTDEPTTESTDVMTTDSLETTDAVETTPAGEPGAAFDLCTLDVSEVESALNWALESTSPYPPEGSCILNFGVVSVNAGYDPPSVAELRDQSVAFGQEVEDTDGIGDEAFIAIFPDDPTYAALAAGQGATILYFTAFAEDDGVTLDQLIEALKILGTLAIEANS